MTSDDQPRTPLTLEFAPEPLDGDEHSVPIAIAEPSFQHSGRIFIGVHPFGKRLGLHLLPADARRLRDHLSKLLLEPEGATGLPADYEPPAQLTAQSPLDDTPTEERSTDWQARIAAAAERTIAKKRERKLGHFRFEAQVGRFVIVIGSINDD